MNEIEKYLDGDTRPLFDACMENRHFFLLWMYKRFHIYGVEAGDLFTDTLILLCDRILERKITRTSCCMLTLLIHLGKGLAIDAMRKQDTENGNYDSVAYESTGTTADDTETQFHRELMQICYEKYLAILSELDRKILIDKFIYGLSAKSIKEKYNLSTNEDVRQKICRAKKAIIERFGQEWSNEDFLSLGL